MPISIVNTANAVVPLVSGSGTGDVSLLGAGTASAITVGSNSQTFTFAGNFNVIIASVTKINGNKTWTNTLATGKSLTFVDLKLNATTQNNQFIVDGTGATAITGSITELTVPGTLVKNGAGTLTVTGTNFYSGATTISAGAVNTQSVGALGTTVGATTVASGAALQIQGGLAFAAEPLSLAGNGVNTNGALRSMSGNNTWSGPITLTANSRIQADLDTLTITGGIGGAFNLTLGGTGNIIVNAAGLTSGAAKTLTKVGTGTVTLNTANSYSGATTVSAGTLVQGDTGAFGTSNSFTVASEAVLNASLAGISLNAGSLTAGRTTAAASDILGNVVLAGGGTLSVGGAAAATFTLAGNLSIDGTTLQLGLGSTTSPGGGISDLIAVNGNLTLAGMIPVTLTALNGPLATGNYTLFTYTGTFVGGAANFAAPTGLPPGRQSYGYDTATPGSVFLTVAGAPATLTWTGNGTTNSWDTTTSGVWSGGSPDNFFDGDLVNFTESGSANSPVNLIGALQPFSVTVNSANSYTFAGTGSIAGAATLTKLGTGKLIIQNANTYTGTTTISAGVIELQNPAGFGGNTAAVTVASGAAIELLVGISVGAKPLSLNGRGTGGTGALRSVGNNAWAGAITVASGARIQSDSGLLTLGVISGVQTLTIGGAGNTILTGVVSGTATAITKVDGGTLQISGAAANTYAGPTTVLGGTLELNKSAAINAFAGNLTIGDGTNPALVKLLAADQIPAVTVTVNANGTWDLNGNAETTTDLQGAGTVTSTAPAVLTLTSANFSGSLTGTGLGLVKANAGTLTLTGTANTFGGIFQLNNGTTVVSKIGDANTGTGPIRILNGNNAAAELVYTGAGDTTSRAIEIFANGAAAAAAVITASGTGPLVLTGGASRTDSTGAGTKTLLLQGTNTGDNTLGGTIANGSNTLRLTKADSGAWVITGTNTYSGPTTITGGVLRVDGTTGIGATTVSAGTLAGSGTIKGALTVQAAGLLAPGNGTTAIGTLNIGDPAAAAPNVALNGSLKIHFDTAVNSRLAVSGNAPGTFDFSAGSQLNLVSTPAFQSAFDYVTPQSWSLITLPAGETATGIANPVIDASSFAPLAAVADFSLVQTGNTIVLAYTPVPEPLCMFGLAFAVLAGRRKWKRVIVRS